MMHYPKTDRNQVRRLPKRACYDAESIYAILDEALICHVGFEQQGQPFVIPTIHARFGDVIYLHGAGPSRLLRHIQAGCAVCLAVTLVDGLALARSAFHHAVNYRSAVVFGRGRLVESDAEKLLALEALTEHVAPGRWKEVRQPNAGELSATTVVAIRIESASAKVRSGPSVDDQADLGLPVWAGEIPLALQSLEPRPDPNLAEGIALPQSLARYRRPG